MAFVRPQILAAAQSNPEAVQSRLVNFLLFHDMCGPIADKVAEALVKKCEGGFVDHFAAELINMALGEGNIVGTQGRSSGATDADADVTLKVKDLAFHVASTAG